MSFQELMDRQEMKSETLDANHAQQIIDKIQELGQDGNRNKAVDDFKTTFEASKNQDLNTKAKVALEGYIKNISPDNIDMFFEFDTNLTLDEIGALACYHLLTVEGSRGHMEEVKNPSFKTIIDQIKSPYIVGKKKEETLEGGEEKSENDDVEKNEKNSLTIGQETIEGLTESSLTDKEIFSLYDKNGRMLEGNANKDNAKRFTKGSQESGDYVNILEVTTGSGENAKKEYFRYTYDQGIKYKEMELENEGIPTNTAENDQDKQSANELGKEEVGEKAEEENNVESKKAKEMKEKFDKVKENFGDFVNTLSSLEGADEDFKEERSTLSRAAMDFISKLFGEILKDEPSEKEMKILFKDFMTGSVCTFLDDVALKIESENKKDDGWSLKIDEGEALPLIEKGRKAKQSIEEFFNDSERALGLGAEKEKVDETKKTTEKKNGTGGSFESIKSNNYEILDTMKHGNVNEISKKIQELQKDYTPVKVNGEYFYFEQSGLTKLNMSIDPTTHEVTHPNRLLDAQKSGEIKGYSISKLVMALDSRDLVTRTTTAVPRSDEGQLQWLQSLGKNEVLTDEEKLSFAFANDPETLLSETEAGGDHREETKLVDRIKKQQPLQITGDFMERPDRGDRPVGGVYKVKLGDAEEFLYITKKDYQKMINSYDTGSMSTNKKQRLDRREERNTAIDQKKLFVEKYFEGNQEKFDQTFSRIQDNGNSVLELKPHNSKGKLTVNMKEDRLDIHMEGVAKVPYVKNISENLPRATKLLETHQSLLDEWKNHKSKGISTEEINKQLAFLERRGGDLVSGSVKTEGLGDSISLPPGQKTVSLDDLSFEETQGRVVRKDKINNTIQHQEQDAVEEKKISTNGASSGTRPPW